MKKTIRHQTIIVLTLLVAAFILLMLCVRCEGMPPLDSTAVIEHEDDVTPIKPENDSIRIKINTAITVKGSIMQNLNFANDNEDRLLRCRIVHGGECIYDSGLLAYGDMLKSDFINAASLASGINMAVAEIYSYDMSENLQSQTDVNVSLDVTW